jgi:hypothetical protein
MKVLSDVYSTGDAVYAALKADLCNSSKVTWKWNFPLSTRKQYTLVTFAAPFLHGNVQVAPKATSFTFDTDIKKYLKILTRMLVFSENVCRLLSRKGCAKKYFHFDL